MSLFKYLIDDTFCITVVNKSSAKTLNHENSCVVLIFCMLVYWLPHIYTLFLAILYWVVFLG